MEDSLNKKSVKPTPKYDGRRFITEAAKDLIAATLVITVHTETSKHLEEQTKENPLNQLSNLINSKLS